ncbi:MAG: diguanylate cyclase [Candidatus Omnitrophica bacterium]|nr:diguanylate cyclase [Candidatus Omnitrophota bacterium]
MKIKKPFLLNITIAIIVASSVLIFAEKGFLKRLELTSLDFLFRLRGPSLCNPHIVIVEISDSDIAAIGRWPWRRRWHALMVKALGDLGVKSIYFDVLFSEKSSEEDDGLFSEAIKEAGNVYLPFAFSGRSTDSKNALLPLEKLSSYTKGTGSINIYPDIDGVLRRVPLFFMGEEGLDLHITLKLAMDYLGLKIKKLRLDYLSLSGPKQKMKIPLIEKNKMLVNWTGKWEETFKHYSFLDVLGAYQDFLKNQTAKIDLKPFKNSICIVAATAMGLYDIESIPLEPVYPSAGIIATAISNILDEGFMGTFPIWFNWLLIYILALAPALLISGDKPLREILLMIPAGAIFLITVFLFFKRGIWIDFSAPLVSFSGSYLIVATCNFVRVSVEKKGFFRLAVTDELTALYNIRYFKTILRAECLMARVEANKSFCIVMSDVDHFKHFNDTYGHQVGDLVLKEVAAVLKASVRSSDIVARYGGEEMIVLLRGTSLEGGLVAGKKIRENVEKHLVKDEDNNYKVTISLGVSSFNSQDNEETVIKRADQGLYKSKELGRNRVATIEKPSFL